MKVAINLKRTISLVSGIKLIGLVVNAVNKEVAVTVEEGTETKGGIGIFMGAVGLGSQGESKASQASVSRIQFEVPVTLPYQETKD